MDVIVAISHGTLEVYDATVQTAKEILSWQAIPSDVTAFAADAPVSYTTTDIIAKILNQLLAHSSDEPVFTSADGETKIIATKEAQKTLVNYLRELNLPNRLSPYDVHKLDLSALSFMAHFHDVPIIEGWIPAIADKLNTIYHSQWPEDVSERQKISCILKLANELCPRECQYVLATVKPAPHDY